MLFLYLLPIFFISAILFHPHKQREQSAPIKGDERIEIRVSAVDGFVADKQKENDCRSNAKAHKVEDFYENNEQNAHKFECVSELIASLREVGNRNKCHIQNDLGNEPSNAYGKVAEYQSAHNGKGIGKHTRGVHRCEPQAVNHKLHQHQLCKNGDASVVFGNDKLEPRRNPFGVADE